MKKDTTPDKRLSEDKSPEQKVTSKVLKITLRDVSRELSNAEKVLILDYGLVLYGLCS